MKLEVCVDNIESVFTAQQAGADRLELCAALALGGITPHYSFIESAVRFSQIPCYVMIRARSGDFLFNDYEIAMMKSDIQMAKQLGAKGIVIGCLTADGNIHQAQCEQLIQAAEGLEITFHRAFDLCPSPLQNLETIIQLGCHRLLTSGQKQTALLGVEMLKTLVKQAQGRIKIMAGAGISAENVLQIIEQSGVDEIHLSGKRLKASQMQYNTQAIPQVAMGNDSQDDQYLNVTDFNKVHLVRTLLDSKK